jgi:hypothetical protein
MSDRKHWLDHPKVGDRAFRILVAVCALLLVIEIPLTLLHYRHPHFGFDTVAFYGVFGFVAFFLIVMAGKQLRKVLKRDEDYYDP